jgi:Na+/melibiose symporter-like transporter
LSRDEAHPARFGPREYLGYAAGEVGNNLTFQMVAAFILLYYTDVAGIAAATAGTLLLVARLWGGVTDLVAGHAVDRTSTRWGKFRPYLLFGSAPLLLLLVAVFSIPDAPTKAARWSGPWFPTRCSRSPTASSTSRMGPSRQR